MSRKRKTILKDTAAGNSGENLNQATTLEKDSETAGLKTPETQEDDPLEKEFHETWEELFDMYEENPFIPKEFQTKVPVNSWESRVGYSSLFRQMDHAFLRRVALYQSPVADSLPIEKAIAAAFHPCRNREEALKRFSVLMRLPVEEWDFVDLLELYSFSPRAAEKSWESAKLEGRAEFESGHLAANITFPEGYMSALWNNARYLGVRESFIDEWQPQGGIEVALVDMLAQTYFQWQYWLEQTVMRSQTAPREECYAYQEWKRQHDKSNHPKSWQEGYWFPSYVSEQQDIEHAVQMADRFNRIFMRTLRQLRDLRRYAPVTINNANQVNIAADGGQQVNVAKTGKEKEKQIT